MSTDYHESFAVLLLTKPNPHTDSTAVPPRHVPLTGGQLGDCSRAPFTHLCNRHGKQGAGNNTEPKKAIYASEKNSGPNHNIIALTFIFAFESKESFQMSKN